MGPVLVFVGALALGSLTIAVIFVLGMRAKTPWVLDAVRWFGRVIGDPYQMRSAGTPGALASVIRQRPDLGEGLRDPLAAVATEDGLMIATGTGHAPTGRRRYRVDQCLRVRRVEPPSDKAGERVTDSA